MKEEIGGGILRLMFLSVEEDMWGIGDKGVVEIFYYGLWIMDY